MKNKAKLISATFLLVILVVTLCACGKVSFTYTHNSDGTYSTAVKLTLNEDISAVDMTVDEAITAFDRGFTKFGYTVTRDNNVVVASKAFSSLAEMKNSLLGNGLSVGAEDVSDENSNAFMYRQNITGTPYLSASYFVDHEYLIKSALIEGGLTAIKAEKVIDAMEGCDSSYTYVTPYRSVKTDADSITRDGNGNYVHTWSIKGQDDTVHITLSAIEGAMWYGIAIIFAVVVVTAFAIIKMIKGRRHGARAISAEE